MHHLLPFHEVIAKNDKHLEFSKKQSKYCSLSTLERKAEKEQSKTFWQKHIKHTVAQQIVVVCTPKK